MTTSRTADHVFRHPAYRALLVGHTVNYLGNGIAPVALAFAVLDLGGDATDLGLVVGLYALADVAAVLFGGVLGDRVSRRVMMQGCSAAAAVVQGVAALALIGGWSSLPFLAATGMLIGALGALGNPSSSAITQQTVPPELLQQAISWRRLGQNAAWMCGAGLAGLVVVGSGSGWALALDAGTFAVAAVAFSGIRVPALPAPESDGMLADVGAGFREVLRHTWLWLLILQALLYHLFYGGAQGRARADRGRRGARARGLGLVVVDDDGRLRDRRAGHAALAPATPAPGRHLAARPDRRLPGRDGLVRLAHRGAAGRLPARLRPGDLQRRLGPLDPAERRTRQAGPGLLVRPDRVVHRPPDRTRR